MSIFLLDRLLGVFCVVSVEEAPDAGTFSGTFSSDVVAGGAFSAAADFLFALVIGFGFGFDIGPDAVMFVGVVVDPLLMIRDSLVVSTSPIVTISTAFPGNDRAGPIFCLRSTMVSFAFPLPIGRGFGRGLATVGKATSTDGEQDCCVVDEPSSETCAAEIGCGPVLEGPGVALFRAFCNLINLS